MHTLEAVIRIFRIASLHRSLFIEHLTDADHKTKQLASIAMQEAAFVEMIEEEAKASGQRSAGTAELANN